MPTGRSVSLRLSSVALCASLSLLAAPGLARADDPPAGEKPAEKKDHDDDSIFRDWKLVKIRGMAHAKERAEFWDAKALPGKDWVWLGLMFNRAEEHAKAVEKFEAFLKYVPDAGTDAKTKENIEKNHEPAYQFLWDSYYKLKEWAKSADTTERYRKDFPVGTLSPESWDIAGRAHRMAGDEAKAAAEFKNAADLKYRSGVVDLVDMHMANGTFGEAKTVLERYLQEDIMGKEQYFAPLQAFLAAIGTPVPGLEKGISISKSDAPTDWKGKPAVFYNWTMQTNGGDKRLQRLEGLRRANADKGNFAGLSTYNKYNPQTNKVEEGMTEAQEIDWYKAFLADSKYATPPCVVLPKDVVEALRMKFEGQFTVLDGEGKLRYMRITDKDAYDLECVGFAVRASASAATTPGNK